MINKYFLLVFAYHETVTLLKYSIDEKNLFHINKKTIEGRINASNYYPNKDYYTLQSTFLKVV